MKTETKHLPSIDQGAAAFVEGHGNESKLFKKLQAAWVEATKKGASGHKQFVAGLMAQAQVVIDANVAKASGDLSEKHWDELMTEWGMGDIKKSLESQWHTIGLFPPYKDENIWPRLPAHMSTLYVLATLDKDREESEKRFFEELKKGNIHPEMTRADALKLKKKATIVEPDEELESIAQELFIAPYSELTKDKKKDVAVEKERRIAALEEEKDDSERSPDEEAAVQITMFADVKRQFKKVQLQNAEKKIKRLLVQEGITGVEVQIRLAKTNAVGA